MYHCAQLDCFFSVDVYLGATSVILPGARPGGAARDDRAGAGRPSCSARRPCGSRCCATPTSTPRDLSTPAQGLLRRLADAGRGAPGAAAPAARTCSSGTSTARPRWRRWPRSCARTSSCRTPAPPAARRSTSRPGSSTTTASRCPPGEVGEIVHRSPHAALGYYERRGEDRRGVPRRLVPLRRPRASSTEDGYLSVVDRKKDMIKTGGENVASREVEEAIYELDGVAEVAVFGISHPHWIEAVTAVVVPKAGRRRSPPRRCIAHARDAAGRLQAPEVRRARRRAAEEPERQDPQARAARAARRPGALSPFAGATAGRSLRPG